MQKLDIDGKDLRIIRNLYWQQSAAVRIENEISNYQPIKRGVRQGCVLSPDFFSLYPEEIMKHTKDLPGLKINGHCINNLRYADDAALLADNQTDLQTLLNTVVTESEKMGLTLNAKKTEVMVISKKKVSPKCNLTVNGTPIQQVNKVKYLGAIITADGKTLEDVKSRIGQAKSAFNTMKNIFTNKEISIYLKKRLLKCYIEPILLYGSESWNLNEAIKRKLESAEMWFLRRMLKISWTERKTNVKVLEEAETTRQLISTIQKRQARFFGHVMRREGLEKLVTTGMVAGKRAVGRQRVKMVDNMKQWLGLTSNTVTIRATEDRDLWKDMIAQAPQHGTT